MVVLVARLPGKGEPPVVNPGTCPPLAPRARPPNQPWCCLGAACCSASNAETGKAPPFSPASQTNADRALDNGGPHPAVVGGLHR